MSESRIIRTPDENWKAILEYLPGVLDEYERICEGKDVAYWYNERAVLSMLVACIWKAQGFALEEYSAKRTGGQGRVDLWLRLRRKEYLVEAKMGYPAKLDGATDGIIWHLDQAREQVLSIVEQDPMTRLSLCFVIPAPTRRRKQDPEELFYSIADDFILEETFSLLMTYCSPRSTWRNLPDGRTTKRFCPGLIVVGRVEEYR